MKILVIGDAILDHYVYGRVNRMSPEDPTVPVLDIQSEEYRLGGCLNVAANLKSLSKEDIHVTSIISDRCKKLLDPRGIIHSYCYHLLSLDGIKKTRVIDVATQKQIVRLDNVEKFEEDFLEEYKFLVNCIEFNEFDCVVVSDYRKGIVNGFVARKLGTFKGTVFVDTKNPNLPMWNSVPNCFIKMNDSEWDKAVQQSHHPVIVTLGKRGAELRNTQDWHETVQFMVTIKEEKVDVTGAGDCFLAGLVSNYLETKDISKAIIFANMVAGKSVLQQGTVEVYL